MAIGMYVEHAVIISTLLSHYGVEIDLGKSGLQLFEGHKNVLSYLYATVRILPSQARPQLYVGPRLRDVRARKRNSASCVIPAADS